ncbi:PREDICTED: putative Peroxidase 48 [Camelina sativa]|uniref:Peroxidase n=1 Tax=Camelina sativa TaxID=90675 RepID=A0ABM0TWJ1_CAMSA|nr:PREDICTED: putative Peroxidase 48 [Camelina sativa]
MKYLGDYKFVLLTCSIIALSIYIAIYRIEFGNSNFTANRTGGGKVSEKRFFDDDFMFMSVSEDIDRSSSLHYDYYRESCPSAEKIIAKSIRDISDVKPSVAPSLIRLLFHDCFIEGCDASVLLDVDESNTSEKEASPNLSLKGFDVIDAIKSELETVCPGVVSCADLLVLAAREAVLVAGGPFYPLETGRKDSAVAFKKIAEDELPGPQANLSVIIARFASRAFSERETVSLFGAHSIGITHCTFFENRLYNFSGTGKPDPDVNPGFVQELKTKCPFSVSASSPSASPGLVPSLPASDSRNSYGMSSGSSNDGVIDLSYNNEGGDENFGTRYYKRLMEKKGLLFSDQQLMGSEETELWVRAYASDPSLFRRDFAMSMMKLSSYHVLTGPLGQVRTTCSKVLPRN